ncbi:hypothetical protein SEA_HANK144_69 [Streptomyces phage Hank144]|uniref:Uncharacterized protein n=1 Tax=Streptomyces phage Hank144 TaxID=2301573 RepID=A0A385DR01_9CAUD|nr:hypothetical protein KGG76_gp69 [Streptomyces phage Hank144]AXQ61122.1 hypothetical protein SEA_HANK144_69 [Streptomyces phage Hank144]
MKKSVKILLVFLVLALFGSLADRQEAEASPHTDRKVAPVKPRPIKLPPSTKVAPLGKLPTKKCSEDDSASRDCFWDAARQGNGKGYSYWVDKQGRVTYLDPKLNNETKRKLFALGKQAAGWEHWGAVWGHQLCYAKVGDTSLIKCYDGFRETS